MKPTRKLTSNQHTTLLLVHKFRFVTSALLSAHKQVNQSASLRTLTALLKSGYLNRHYDSSYKLQGKAARYYLSKQGIQYLKDHPDVDIDPKVLNLHYKNKSMSQGYIDHCIDVYTLYLQLKDQYPSHEIFSRQELARDERYITPAPDLHLEAISDTQNDIFVDIFTSTQTWIIKKRVDAYIDHYEDGEWDGEYPEVHIYCDKQSQIESVQKHIQERFENEFIEGLNISLRYCLQNTTKPLYISLNE